jgi:hypothetical protein
MYLVTKFGYIFLWIIAIFGYFTKLRTQNAVTHITFVKWSVESIHTQVNDYHLYVMDLYQMHVPLPLSTHR